MDKNLAGFYNHYLKPALVWKHFAEIVNIPRPSHSEEKIRQYLVDFAVEHGIEHCVDEAGNVYMRKAATAGMEGRKGIVLQAHVDMVPQKNNDKVFDFENDPIEAYIDGEWVTANGTTLGADNGIGVAAILAVMEDDTIEHGPIEGLFTATEETGMDGAFGLKEGLLQGDILLNLDSVTEGELYVGCAGGIDVNAEKDCTHDSFAAPAQGWKALKLSVTGCKGGHSGIQIVCQRANANKLLFRVLYAIEQAMSVEMGSVDGGGLRNAIPREAVAVIMVEEANVEQVYNIVAEFEKIFVAEYAGVEDSISVAVEECPAPEKVFYPYRLIGSILVCPDGVEKMSMAMEGLVQTSTNMARVVGDSEKIKVQCLVRSSVRSEKEALANATKVALELSGFQVELSGSYDGWNPNMESPILKAMLASYEALYGKKPAVTAIHAGLECGIIGGKYPNLDMISFGPTICYPHSPDEKVEIASVEKFYDFLLHTLKNAPEK
ncbi:MAG: aminoacyl-histidine dipeptidase [Alistipes sp.]|nr:aminoacyl-histidine dipeptidase [Alistipes sp.]